MSDSFPIDEDTEVLTWRAPQMAGSGHSENVVSKKQESQTQKEQSQKLGYLEGLEQGRLAAQAELNEQLTYLRQVVECLSAPLNELDTQVEKQLVHLAIVIAHQLVRRELRTDPKQILGVVREALKILPIGSRDIQINLNPDDAELVRETLAKPGRELAWQIFEDPMLSRGGCTVSTHASRIDARIESRIGKVFAELLSGDRENDD